MWEIQARDLPYERKYTEKQADGLKLYADQPMKVQLIEERAAEVFSEYTLGPHFIDFCLGPHVPIDEEDQGVQAAVHRGRVLEGR